MHATIGMTGLSGSRPLQPKIVEVDKEFLKPLIESAAQEILKAEMTERWRGGEKGTQTAWSSR